MLDECISELLTSALKELENSSTASLDAELLLSFCLQKDRSFLYTWPEFIVDQQQKIHFHQLIGQRKKGYPVAYLVGVQHFWTLVLEVSPDTLIPRPETEEVVSLALKKKLPNQAKILDLGTGTGAIALSLAVECPQWHIVGVDCSDEIVALAIRNAKKYSIQNVDFIKSDWFEGVSDRYDLIISNPPYVVKNDPHLKQGDVQFEPLQALESGVNGLDDIQHIINNASSFLNRKGIVIIEHGYHQKKDVQYLMKQVGFVDVITHVDLSGHNRMTEGCLP